MAVRLHLRPADVWAMDARDLMTVVDVLNEQAEATKRASRR